MSDKLIIEAFQIATTAAVVSSVVSTLPIEMLGRTGFTPPNDQKYLQFVHIPNNRTGETWGNEKTYQGLIRLLLHWPKIDEGIYEPMEAIESIGSHFNKTTSLLNGGLKINIYENPDFTGLIETDKDDIYPVSMPYRCFKS